MNDIIMTHKKMVVPVTEVLPGDLVHYKGRGRLVIAVEHKPDIGSVWIYCAGVDTFWPLDTRSKVLVLRG